MEIITSQEADIRRKKLKSCWSDESRLSQEIMIAILFHLEVEKAKPKRKISEFNKFFGRKIKEGLTAQKIGELWQMRKNR